MGVITLSADEGLIEGARRQAEADGTTLDAQFQLWLADYMRSGLQADGAAYSRRETEEEARAIRKAQADRAAKVMLELRGKLYVGRKLTREEMNER